MNLGHDIALFGSNAQHKKLRRSTRAGSCRVHPKTCLERSLGLRVESC